VVRFITAHDYGLNAMMEAPLAIMSLFCTLGLDSALVCAKHIEHKQLQSAFGLLLIINGILFLGFFFGGPLIAHYYNEPDLEGLAKALAFIFILVPFRVIPNALLDRDLKFKLKAIVDFTTSIITAVLTLALAFYGAGVWALVIGYLTNRVLSTIMLMVFQPWIITPSLNVSILRELLSFGGILALASSIFVINERLISIVAGPVLGAHLLGIYAVAFEFAMLPMSKAMSVLYQIIFPAFSKFQEQRDMVSYYMEKSLTILSLGLFPVMIGTACISHEFVSTILGDNWMDVALPLTILSLIMPIRLTHSFIRPILSSMGRADLTLKLALTTFIILLPLVLIGVNYGLIGLVLAVVATEIIVAFVTIRMSKPVINTSFYKIAISLRPAIISSTIMALFVLTAKALIGSHSGLPGMLLEIGVGAMSYLFMLRIFYRKHLEDAINIFLGRNK
jgi:O-antigen/teichoic acid export membrane protein